MIQIGPVYVLLVVLLIFLVKIIDCGQLIIKQRVSFNPILNALYYMIGVFCVLVSLTMFNARGLIYHRLMTVILLGVSAFIFIPSVFVKPTKNSLISTLVGTCLAIIISALTFFSIESPQDGIFIGIAVYLGVFIIIGAVFHNFLNRFHEKGTKELFYKQRLWELLNNRKLLIPVFALLCIEFALQYAFGITLLFFLPF